MNNTGTLKLTTPTDREIVMTRVFDAPRHLVYEALIKPELLKRWLFGPPGWSLDACEINLKVGGRYRFVMHGPDETEMGWGGVYREIVPAERVVASERFDDAWYPGEALVTHALVELGGKTTLTLSILYESREARDTALKSPIEQGVTMGYDRLAEMLASSADKHDLVITRVFAAPVAVVWKAWTDPEQVMRWWGPNGFTSPLARMDFRVGGTSLVCMRAPKEFGGQDMYSTWEYRVIEPLRRIEYIHNLADRDGHKADPVKLGMPPDFPQDQGNTVTFKALAGNKTEMIVTEYGWTAGRMIDMAKLGLEQCLDKMAGIFAKA